MVKAQEWTNEKFPTKKSKEKVKGLYIKNDQGIDRENNETYYFYKTQLEGELDLDEFVNLKYLEINGCNFSVETYQKLTKIDLTNCKKLKTFKLYYNDGNVVIEGNNTLKYLYLENCENLVDFRASERLINLNTLKIDHCPKLKKIANLESLRNLNSLRFHGCSDLAELSGLNELNKLVNFSFNTEGYYWYSHNSKLTSLDLTKMSSLQDLFIGYCSQLKEIKGLEKLKSLNSLSFESCPQLLQPDFKLMTTLQNLSVNNCSQFTCQPEDLPKELVKLSLTSQNFSTYYLEKLSAKENLTKLVFSSCGALKELNNLNKLSKLGNLRLHNLNNLINLKGVGELNDLTDLTIESCPLLEKVDGLEKLVKLGRFEFKDCPKLKVFTPFEQWKQELIKAEQKIQGLKIEAETEEQKNQEMWQKLAETKNQIAELEKTKEEVKNDAQQKLTEKIKEIEKLKEKQLTENEKKILEKLEELFSIFGSEVDIDDKDIEKLEKSLGGYRVLDFTDTPNLPKNFKLENEGLVAHIENFVKCYQNWQIVAKEKDELEDNIQEKEKEIKERKREINALKSKIENLTSNFEHEQQFAEQQIEKIAELQEVMDVLNSGSSKQGVSFSLWKQLNTVQNEVNQSQKKLSAEQARVEFLQEKLAELRKEKSTLQTDLTKKDDEITKLKKRIEALDFLTEETDENNDKLKLLTELYKKNCNKIITTMTTTRNNTTNEQKTFILEWKGAELKDGTMCYEKFEVIAGSERENLFFYSTFFADNIKFKKGDFYQLSMSGDFVQDSSGAMPGGFDDSGIIQGISGGSHEFERVFPSLIIKEIWEEKESNLEKLNALEEDFQKKKEDFSKTNQELFNVKEELSSLKNMLSNLQLEKAKSDEKISLLEKNIQIKEQEINRISQELSNSEEKTTHLQNQFSSLETENREIKSKWTSPENRKKLDQELKDLKNKWNKERRNNQFLIESLEEVRGRKLGETIETKLVEKKKELDRLKIEITGKLGSDQKFLLENFLEKQEDFDLALFDDISQTSRPFLRAKDRLQDAKDKLVSKLGSGEIEELCKLQTELGKLETSQKQWEKMDEQQRKEEQEQFESFMETPPMTPRSSY